MKRGKLQKQSKTKVSTLKRKLWKVFADYIKLRDKYTCFTCGRKGEGSGIHAGHFINKSIGGIALYYHEENVHAQCYNCNINLGGNQYAYGVKLGKEKVDEIYTIKNQINKWSEQDYLQRIEHYTRAVDNLRLQQ